VSPAEPAGDADRDDDERASHHDHDHDPAHHAGGDDDPDDDARAGHHDHDDKYDSAHPASGDDNPDDDDAIRHDDDAVVGGPDGELVCFLVGFGFGSVFAGGAVCELEWGVSVGEGGADGLGGGGHLSLSGDPVAGGPP
jgi:hypothetical protein